MAPATHFTLRTRNLCCWFFSAVWHLGCFISNALCRNELLIFGVIYTQTAKRVKSTAINLFSVDFEMRASIAAGCDFLIKVSKHFSKHSNWWLKRENVNVIRIRGKLIDFYLIFERSTERKRKLCQFISESFALEAPESIECRTILPKDIFGPECEMKQTSLK